MKIKHLLMIVFACGIFFWGIALGHRSWTFSRLARSQDFEAEYEATKCELIERTIQEHRENVRIAEDRLGGLDACVGRTPVSHDGSLDAAHWRAEIQIQKALAACMQPRLATASAKRRYHEQLAQKYWRAVGRPWRSVAPDPPEPE